MIFDAAAGASSAPIYKRSHELNAIWPVFFSGLTFLPTKRSNEGPNKKRNLSQCPPREIGSKKKESKQVERKESFRASLNAAVNFSGALHRRRTKPLRNQASEQQAASKQYQKERHKRKRFCSPSSFYLPPFLKVSATAAVLLPRKWEAISFC